MAVVCGRQPACTVRGGMGIASLGLAVLLLAVGCHYVPDRLRDAADMVRVSVGPCLGLGVEAKATGLFHPSLGVATSSLKVGWDSRHCYLAWLEREAHFPMSIPRTAAAEAAWLNPLSAVLPAFYSRRAVNPLQDCTSISRLFYSPPPGRGEDDLGFAWRLASTVGDFEVGVSAIFVSARVGVNAPEVLDFLLGLFTLDLAGDDGATAARAADAKAKE